jgi:hypothetical protein
MKIVRALMVACPLAGLLVSCRGGGFFSAPPAGSYSDVVLVTETGDLSGPAAGMARSLQHEIDFYTKVELQFTVRIVPASEFKKEVPAKNMVILGVVNRGRLGRVIERFIGASGTREVLEGKRSVFAEMGRPVAGQLTVVVAAPSDEALARVARDEGALIREILEEGSRERLREAMLKDGEDRPLERALAGRYGFGLRIPKAYTVEEDRPDLPGIALINPGPPRVVSVSWRPFDTGSVALADSNALFRMRSEVAFRLFDRYAMRRDLVTFAAARLGAHAAIRMDGYWESSLEPAGGSFACFFVADPARSRVWMIDCLVYAPGRGRNELLREAIAVAETFSLPRAHSLDSARTL